MPNQDDRPYLSDVIDYDRDIEPYRFIKIYSGVGSGKNTFVDNLITGRTFRHADGKPVGKKYVLLITSRRAKVNEQLRSDTVVYDPQIGMFDSPYADWFADLDPRYEDYYESPTVKLPNLDGMGRSRVYRRTCINTNAKIECILRDHYTPFDAESHPWERFDMIIIDEVHALVADASYQSAPFYVRRLIEETLSRSSKCKVIVMTGSPQVLEDQPLFNDAHCIDLMDTCKNIRPQSIRFISKEQAKEKQLSMLRDGNPFVAFFNRIRDMFSLIGESDPSLHSTIAVSFSDEEKRQSLAESNEALYQQIIHAEEHLANHQKLPTDIKAFLTTAKNKEGINIKNKDFHVMFVEAHNEVDVIQMVGRLRNPIETLYIVVDSVPHHDMESRFERKLTKSNDFIPAINAYYQSLCQDQGIDLHDPEDIFRQPAHRIESLGDFIDYIHGKFPYIRYDYFTDEFVFYSEQEEGKDYYAHQHSTYRNAAKTTAGLQALAARWFPGIPSYVEVSLEGDIQQAVDSYLTNNRWLNGERAIRQNECRIILDNLNRITGENSRQLSTILRHYGYQIGSNSHRSDARRTITKAT